MLRFDIKQKSFRFLQPAHTSRGVYTERKSFFIHLYDEDNPKIVGIGECAPLPDLSIDAMAEESYLEVLRTFCKSYIEQGRIDYEAMHHYPSMLMGLETAVAHLEAKGNYNFFNIPFGRGEVGIPINGLVWMGSFEEMVQRMQEKLEAGYDCVKFKIGSIDFASELAMLRALRDRFSEAMVQIRVDANGAFAYEDVFEKLEQLSKFGIHSIEQPIKQKQWKKMAAICRNTPIAVALDEELIGVNRLEEKIDLLDTIAPQYIVLKPTLHGGMYGAEGWIQLAQERGIGHWITSALESNIGLNAIAQFTSKVYGHQITFPQGLGTGQLFTNNIVLPLTMDKAQIWFKP